LADRELPHLRIGWYVEGGEVPTGGGVVPVRIEPLPETQHFVNVKGVVEGTLLVEIADLTEHLDGLVLR
jgi:hypothetical protein